MKINLDPTQSMILKPRRVFHCEKENRMMNRVGVWKDAEGKYHCGSCGAPVEDVTNTETGKWCLNFMEI